MDVKDMEQENSSNFDLPLEEIIAYNDLPTIRNETEETLAMLEKMVKAMQTEINQIKNNI